MLSVAMNLYCGYDECFISRQVAAVLDEYIYPELYRVLLPWDPPLSMIPT